MRQKALARNRGGTELRRAHSAEYNYDVGSLTQQFVPRDVMRQISKYGSIEASSLVREFEPNAEDCIGPWPWPRLRRSRSSS